MTKLLHAEILAKQISRLLAEIYTPIRAPTIEQEAGVVPLDRTRENLALVINVHVPAEIISLTLLWDLTVPLIEFIASRVSLRDFVAVSSQISARSTDQGT